MEKNNWGLAFSAALLMVSGILFLTGSTLDAIYFAVVSVFWWVMFDV